MISCSPFKEIDRLQPFHVKISAEALALADFHCNVTNIETIGYISGHWNGDQNCMFILNISFIIIVLQYYFFIEVT